MAPTLENLRPVDSARGRELALKRWHTVRVPALYSRGQWGALYEAVGLELLETYAERGPQYRLLCDLAAGAYVQVKRMESTGALARLPLASPAPGDFDLDEPKGQAEYAAAQREFFAASEATKVYLKAIEQIRRLVDQVQKYTEARKAEIVVTEVNNAVVEVLRIVESTLQDPVAFAQVARAVYERLVAA